MMNKNPSQRAARNQRTFRIVVIQLVIIALIAGALALGPRTVADAQTGVIKAPQELGIVANQSDRLAFGTRASSSSIVYAAALLQTCSGSTTDTTYQSITLGQYDGDAGDLIREGIATAHDNRAIEGHPYLGKTDPGYRWSVTYCKKVYTETTPGSETCTIVEVRDYTLPGWPVVDSYKVCTTTPPTSEPPITTNTYVGAVQKRHPDAAGWVRDAVEVAFKSTEEWDFSKVFWNSSPGYDSRQIIGLPTFLAASPRFLNIGDLAFDWEADGGWPKQFEGQGGPIETGSDPEVREIVVDLSVSKPTSQWQFEEPFGTYVCDQPGRLFDDANPADEEAIRANSLGGDVCQVSWAETSVAEDDKVTADDTVKLEAVQLLYDYTLTSTASRVITELASEGELKDGKELRASLTGDGSVEWNSGQFTTEFNGSSQEFVIGEVQTYQVDLTNADLTADQGAGVTSPWLEGQKNACQKASGWFIVGFFAGPICEIVTAFIDVHLAILEVAWDGVQLIGTIAKAVASGLWSLIKGCASMAVDFFLGLKDTAETVLSAAGDPSGTIQEISDTVSLVKQQLADPETRDEFIKTVLFEFAGELGSLDMILKRDPNTEQLLPELKDNLSANDWLEWGGRIACEVIAAFFGGKLKDLAGGSKLVQRLLAWIDDKGIKIPTIKIPDTILCVVAIAGFGLDAYEIAQVALGPRAGAEQNSFPAGTLVLMADGTHVPIENIAIGDQVLSWDEPNQYWEAQTVVDQWSAIDDGQLATATLVDGSTITATDGHLFWVESDSLWTELQHVGAGDELLTPTGAVAVAEVTETVHAERQVWELTVTENHNFAVYTGTANVLVHNSCASAAGFSNPGGRPLFRQNPDGSVTYDSDAIGVDIDNVLLDADGNPIVVKTEGFEIVYQTDGTVTIIEAGPPVVIREGGIANADGSVTVDNPDGSISLIDEAGNSTTLPPDSGPNNPGDIETDPEFSDNYDDDLGSDGYDPDQDPLGPGCVANSFPTGTLVLMADGSHQSIDQIRPGDIVRAYNPQTNEWSPRAVVDQWSYVDTDEMATITLADGSQVSATDHHLFWVEDRGVWTEAEALASTDWLLTPDGAVTVQHVDLWPSNDTLVWELTVEVDHTFTVAAGPHDVVVHNQDVQGDTPADLDANYQAHLANGGTRENWFDSLSVAQVEAVMGLPSVDGKQDIRRARLKNGLRNDGGVHEFFPVSMAIEAKRMGLTAADIHSFTLATNDFAGIHPETGQVFNHKSSTASYEYHQELYRVINETLQNGGTAQDALDALNDVNREWSVSTLPGAADLYTENKLQKLIDDGTLTEAQAQQIRDRYLAAFENEATPLGDADEDWSDREYTPPDRLSC